MLCQKQSLDTTENEGRVPTKLRAHCARFTTVVTGCQVVASSRTYCRYKRARHVWRRFIVGGVQTNSSQYFQTFRNLPVTMDDIK